MRFSQRMRVTVSALRPAPRPRGRGVWGTLLATTAAGALWVTPVRADDVTEANGKLIGLENTIERMAANFKEEPPPEPNIAERRLVDAQTLIELGNFPEASTLLFDIVEKYPDTRVYDDAVVLLGEALFKERDLLAARRYFRKAVEKKTGSRREQQALQRLIEIALRTDDFEGVDDYLERLAGIPAANLEPSVPYVRGKYLFFRDRLDESQAALMQVGSGNPYHVRARYFLGTLRVKQGDLAAAVTAFDEVLKLQPQGDEDREVQDLARLALGRVHYEQAQFDKARDMYGSVDRRSKHFSDALYESAWTSIKANDFKSAYRALDLVLLQNPDNPKAPELRLLVGNLNLRLANYFEASETFGATREQFEPIHAELLATIEKSRQDPQYFQNLLGSDLEKFDITVFVPQAASRWVKDEPEIARVVSLASDVGVLNEGIRDSDSLLERLDRAVNGGGQVAIFPDLRALREESSEVFNSAMQLRKAFAEKARKLAEPYLSAEDRTALASYGEERGRLEEQLKDLPLTAKDLRERDSGSRGQLQDLDGRASEINVLIQGLEAELVALRSYHKTVPEGERTVSPEELDAQTKDIEKMIAEMTGELNKLRDAIADARRQNTAAGAAGEGERYAVKRLSELITLEQQVLARARSRMNGNEQREFDNSAAILERSDKLHAAVAKYDERVDGAAEKRLVTIRSQIETERNNLQSVRDALTKLTTESQDVGGGLAQTILTRVTERFYDLVVQSDVGLIDVAWGLKDQKTQNLSKLINQQKNEMRALDEDFRSIMGDEQP